MSWQFAVLLLLAGVLVAGAVWYERARPPSQLVALVAALAALAVAGRVAFSPIPNVVPTTDIALIAGYALGGPPGFAVGALAGLVSNFWLGQGPWTPWQMAGWGLTGVFGAALARAGLREIGRLQLACACALAGLAYGALLDLSLMVTYGGEQSLDRYLALAARGLPFNLAHAAGNFTLALVAGPALIRMLTRYRGRFEFAWRRRPAIGAACLLAAVALVPGGGEAPADAAGPSSAVSWLRSAQNADGGFGSGPGEPSNPTMTGWAVLGMEAAGVHPADVRSGSGTALSYLRSTAQRISTTGDTERTILVVAAAGADPRRFGGRDLVARLLARRQGDGSWGGQVNLTAFGILALDAAGRPGGNSRSAGWLRGSQNDDGGWGFAPGAASDADSTGAALQALASARGSAGSIRRGVEWLRGAQRRGGGFNLAGGPVNAQSTAWAAQGLIAAEVSPRSVRRGGRSPLDYLASVQAGDGHYRYSGRYDQTPVWVTGQALQAVSGRALPLPAVAATTGGSGGASVAPAPATAAPGGSPIAAKKPTSGGAAAPAAPPDTAVGTLERFEVEPPDDDDGFPLGLVAGVALAGVAAGFGFWALRRRGVI